MACVAVPRYPALPRAVPPPEARQYFSAEPQQFLLMTGLRDGDKFVPKEARRNAIDEGGRFKVNDQRAGTRRSPRGPSLRLGSV